MKKPTAIIHYNKRKDGTDVSDQLGSYFSPLRKTVRKYHKTAFELICNTAAVNAAFIFSKLTGKKMSCLQF